MKKFIITLLALATIIGCSSYKLKEPINRHLPKHKIVGLRNGVIILKNGKRLIFTQAVFTCNAYMIRIESEMVHQTVLWINVKRIYLKNPY